MADFAIEGAFRHRQRGVSLAQSVDSVNLRVDLGDVLAIVGESGSGKSVSMLALMSLLPWTADVTADTLQFDGLDFLHGPAA